MITSRSWETLTQFLGESVGESELSVQQKVVRIEVVLTDCRE